MITIGVTGVMPALVSQVILLVYSLSGSLVYQIGLLLAFVAAALVALNYRSTVLGRRLFWTALALGAMRLVLLAAALWAGNDLAATLPPLDRAASTFTLLLLLWALVFPEPHRPADFTVAVLGVLTVAGLGLSLGLGPAARGSYNGSAQESIWEMAQLGLLSAGVVLLAAHRGVAWPVTVALAALLLGGHALQFLFPFYGAVAGPVRLAEFVAVPMFMLVAARQSVWPLAVLALPGPGAILRAPTLSVEWPAWWRLTRAQQGWVVALGYLSAVAVAEALVTLQAPEVGAGLFLHGLILVALLMHAALAAHGAQQKFLLALALAPLIRLLSLSMPLIQFPYIYWFVIVGAPLFVAAFVVAEITGVRRADVGLAVRAWPWELLVGLSGAAFGYVEYLILRPAPLISALTWQQFWLPALILTVFTGLLEEVVFRGLLQHAALERLGQWGVLFVAVLFAVLHLGYRSALDVAFVFGVGLFFGLAVRRSRSILGVTLAHSLTNIGLFLVFPLFFGH